MLRRRRSAAAVADDYANFCPAEALAYDITVVG